MQISLDGNEVKEWILPYCGVAIFAQKTEVDYPRCHLMFDLLKQLLKRGLRILDFKDGKRGKKYYVKVEYKTPKGWYNSHIPHNYLSGWELVWLQE